MKNQFLKSDDEDDEDGDLFGESSYESSSSDDGAGFSLRDKFLRKKTTGDDDGEKRTQKKAKKIKEKPGKDFRDAESDDEQWETVKRGSSMPMEKPKMFKKDDEITITTVYKKLNEIMAARGKKGTDRKEQIELLHELMAISEENNLGPGMTVKIQFNIIMSIYNYNPSVSDAMKVDYWEKVLIKIDELLDMLINKSNLSIGD